jgi:AcrR family transcriptional regulator
LGFYPEKLLPSSQRRLPDGRKPLKWGKGEFMPPKQKIAREMIRDAAFQIAREEGWENISAISIAAHLHCSTQPVLYSYKSIEEIRKDAYQEADRFHSAFLMNESQSLQDDSESPESKKNEATAEDAESRRGTVFG